MKALSVGFYVPLIPHHCMCFPLSSLSTSLCSGTVSSSGLSCTLPAPDRNQLFLQRILFCFFFEMDSFFNVIFSEFKDTQCRCEEFIIRLLTLAV